jgi:hypothetical protein
MADATSKPIRLTEHARERCRARGASEEEVRDAIRRAPHEDARHNRRTCRANFAFDANWRGVRYAVKQVMPVFVEEAEEIVVVTVYVYYF